MIRILAIQRDRGSLLATALAAAGMLVAYPWLQSVGNVDIWFAVIEPWNLALYLAFSLLFGLMVSLQVHSFRKKTCSIRGSSAPGLAGTIGGFFVLQCPSCAVLLSFFMPLNAIIFIATYNTWLTLGTIALMLLAVHLLGGFRKA